MLLDNGADIDALNEGDAALILAFSSGHVKVVQTLLDNGAETDAQNRKGETALIAASQRVHTKTLKLLLDKDACNSSPYGNFMLLCSSNVGDYESVEILMGQGVNVNAELDSGFIRLYLPALFHTAMLSALHHGHNHIVKLLLNYGADVNAYLMVEGIHGVALEHALIHGDDEMIIFKLIMLLIQNLWKPNILILMQGYVTSNNLHDPELH